MKLELFFGFFWKEEMKMELFFWTFLERRNENGIVFWTFLERTNENGIVFWTFLERRNENGIFFGFFFGKKRNENGIVLPETEQFELTAPDEIFSNATKTPIFKLLNAESQICLSPIYGEGCEKIGYLRCCFCS